MLFSQGAEKIRKEPCAFLLKHSGGNGAFVIEGIFVKIYNRTVCPGLGVKSAEYNAFNA